MLAWRLARFKDTAARDHFITWVRDRSHGAGVAAPADEVNEAWYRGRTHAVEADLLRGVDQLGGRVVHGAIRPAATMSKT
jgi:hypothetical protein